MQMEWYFPAPVWWEETNITNTEMLNLCYKMQEDDTIGRTLSNQGGWQSMDFRPGMYPEMKNLEDKILNQANNCLKDFGFRTDLCFVDIENFWFNINKQNHTNSVHIHDNAFVSGVYYLQAEEKQGSINFYKNQILDYAVVSQAPIDNFTPISASAISFQPKTGKLIMFPGWMPHGVERNELDKDRISVSFNVKIFRTDDERYRTTPIKRD